MQARYDQLLNETEIKAKETGNEMSKVVQENLQVKLDNKRLAMANDTLSQDLNHAKEDIEQLFYAVQLLIRGLRPYRVKLKDLLAQKLFLARQVDH